MLYLSVLDVHGEGNAPKIENASNYDLDDVVKI